MSTRHIPSSGGSRRPRCRHRGRRSLPTAQAKRCAWRRGRARQRIPCRSRPGRPPRRARRAHGPHQVRPRRARRCRQPSSGLDARVVSSSKDRSYPAATRAGRMVGSNSPDVSMRARRAAIKALASRGPTATHEPFARLSRERSLSASKRERARSQATTSCCAAASAAICSGDVTRIRADTRETEGAHRAKLLAAERPSHAETAARGFGGGCAVCIICGAGREAAWRAADRGIKMRA